MKKSYVNNTLTKNNIHLIQITLSFAKKKVQESA